MFEDKHNYTKIPMFLDSLSMKTYVVMPSLEPFHKTVQMRGHNICLMEKVLSNTFSKTSELWFVKLLSIYLF